VTVFYIYSGLKGNLDRNYLMYNVSIYWYIPLTDTYYTQAFIAYQVLAVKPEEERPLETPRRGHNSPYY
jgi:hypothetical protein